MHLMFINNRPSTLITEILIGFIDVFPFVMLTVYLCYLTASNRGCHRW